MLLHAAGAKVLFDLLKTCQVQRLAAEVSNLRIEDNSHWTSVCSATLR